MKGTNTIIQIITPISAVTVGFLSIFKYENGRGLNSPAATTAVEIKRKMHWMDILPTRISDWDKMLLKPVLNNHINIADMMSIISIIQSVMNIFVQKEAVPYIFEKVIFYEC